MSSTNIDVENSKQVEEFAKAGRTGRRNALPDILSVSMTTCGTSDLTKALQKLQTNPSGKHLYLLAFSCY